MSNDDDSGDAIELFLLQGKRLSLAGILSIYSGLKSTFLKTGQVSLKDIPQFLVQNGIDIPESDVSPYEELFLETLLFPSNVDGEENPTYQIRPEMMHRDSFLSCLVQSLYHHCKGGDCSSVKEFLYELETELNFRCEFPLQEPSTENIADESFSFPPFQNFSFENNVENKGDFQQFAAQQVAEFEKSEPIIRFLAQVRKMGMDVLFPQSTHDKVRLSSCFVILV